MRVDRGGRGGGLVGRVGWPLLGGWGGRVGSRAVLPYTLDQRVGHVSTRLRSAATALPSRLPFCRAYRLHAALSAGRLPPPAGRAQLLKACDDLCRQQRRGSKPPPQPAGECGAGGGGAGGGERLAPIPEGDQQQGPAVGAPRGRKRALAAAEDAGDAPPNARGQPAAPAGEGGAEPRSTRKRTREAAEATPAPASAPASRAGSVEAGPSPSRGTPPLPGLAAAVADGAGGQG